MRLFFAITIPDPERERLTHVQARLRAATGPEGLRWEDPAKFHLTLSFVGEVSAEQVAAVKAAGTRAAALCAPYSITLDRLGAFPRRGPARVLWVGCQNEVPEFQRQAEYLEGELMGSAPGGGARGAAQKASPHVTLARIKTPAGAQSVARVLRTNNSFDVDKEGVISVSNVVLFHSELRPQGSVYTVLETFPLAPS